MAASAATQTPTIGTPAASGDAGGANGGQAAPDSKAGGDSSGGNGGAQGERSSVLGDGKAGEKPAGAAADGKKGDGQGQDGAAAGELEIKLPDGVKVDAEVLKAFTGVAKEAMKEAGITDVKQASALLSKIAAWDAERQSKAVADQVSAWEKQDDVWVAEIRKDPELGGEKLQASTMAAQAAVRRFGGPDLRKFLADHGIGNAPPLVRAFAKIGLAMGEDTTGSGVGAGGGKPKPVTREEKAVAYYDKITPKAG